MHYTAECLDLSTFGYNMKDPSATVPLNSKIVIPEPEHHFSFSTALMVMAVEFSNENQNTNSATTLTMLIENGFNLWRAGRG